MNKTRLALQETTAVVLHFVVRKCAWLTRPSAQKPVDLERSHDQLYYPYGTACAVKIRLTSLISGTQYRFMPQLSNISCNFNQLLKMLAECRNWMPRELVCGDSWSKTLRFP
jgi:hypothetical protein